MKGGLLGFGSSNLPVRPPVALTSAQNAIFIDIVGKLGRTQFPEELKANITKSLQEPNPPARLGLLENALVLTVTHVSNNATGLEKKVAEIGAELKTVEAAVGATSASRPRSVSFGGKRSKKSRKRRSKKHQKTRRRSA
jgi:hypothetical protein